MLVVIWAAAHWRRRADCGSQHEKKIKRHFLLMSAILAAQKPPLSYNFRVMITAITILGTIIGIIAAIVYLSEYWVNKIRTTEIEPRNIHIKKNDDYVVLAAFADEHEENKEINMYLREFIEKYEPRIGEKNSFLLNPFYHHNIKLTASRDMKLAGIISAVLVFGFILLIAFVPSEKAGPWFLSFGYAFGIVGLFLSYKCLSISKEHKLKATIAKEYIDFLDRNKIFVGLSMLQKKDRHGKDLI